MRSGPPPTVVTQQQLADGERVLRDDPDHLNALLATIPGIIWEVHGRPGSDDQQQIFVSKYAEELLGHSIEEWIRRPGFWLRLIHREDRRRAARELAECFRNKKEGSSEFRCVTKDGAVIWVESRSTVLFDEQGDPVGMRGVTLDITRRKLLEIERSDLLAHQDHSQREARAAAIRTSVLQRATALLSEAVHPEQVGSIIIEETTATFGAHAGTAAILAHDALTVTHRTGPTPSAPESGDRIDIHARLPLTDAARSGEALWLESADALHRNYPDLAERRDPATGSWVAVPLSVKGKAIGAIELSFSEPRRFGEDDRRFLLAITQQGAEALERARLYEAEKAAHRQEEEMRKAWSFLAEAGTILSSSLDYNRTLESVAQLAVPILADWCSVDLHNDGQLRHVAIAHRDADKLEFAREVRRCFPPRPDAPHGVAAVMRTRQSELIPHLTDELLETTIRDPEELSLLRQLGLRSCMVVPLVARNRLVGVMTFATGESPRHYSETDLAVAEGLAARAALAIDNAGLYAKAQQAVKAQNDMVAVVSHDLDNPLTVIDTSTQILDRLLTTPEFIPSQMPGVLEQMRASTRMAGRLIQDLREVGHIESGFLAISCQSVPASALFAEVLDMFLHSAEQRGIALRLAEVGEQAQVECDRVRIVQVLANLLGNALKFTPKGKSIQLACTPLEEHACFSVRDTGPGIAPQDIPNLFNKYWKANNPGMPGSGLGLYIARELVKAHGGEIWVESQPYQGATFHFTLPLAGKA